MSLSTHGDVLARMGLDLLAICALVYGLFLPRHRRTDLVVVYALFNVGLFLALVVISAGEVSMGVGFGLFAVLSIVRLRSEPFSNRELAYFFVALVLALVSAIDVGSLALTGALMAVALLATWAFDHPQPAAPRARDARAGLRRRRGAAPPPGDPAGRARARRLRARGRLRARDHPRRRPLHDRSEGGPACRRGARMNRSRSNELDALQDRVDVKYVIGMDTFTALTEELRGTHRVLEIDGRREFTYRTTLLRHA